MAQKSKVLKTRVKRNGATNNAGYHICSSCGGTGVKLNVGRGAKKS